MDPQKLSQLDPKLRDAYQRVMGTSIPQAQTPTPTPVPTPLPTEAQALEGDSTPEPTPPIQEPPVPQPEPAISPQPPVQASNFVQMNSEVAATPTSANFSAPVPQAQTMTLKKKNGIMIPVLFGIVGLIFIIIYALFWTKIFNFKLPFLPL